MTLRETLRSYFPFKAHNGLATLEWVPETWEEQREIVQCTPDHPTFITMLVVWENQNYIRDVKEQLIYLPTNLPPELANHGGRNDNFCRALAKVLADVLAKPETEFRMPADYFRFDALGKRTFGTEHDFENALRKKSRLGGYL